MRSLNQPFAKCKNNLFCRHGVLTKRTACKVIAELVPLQTTAVDYSMHTGFRVVSAVSQPIALQVLKKSPVLHQ